MTLDRFTVAISSLVVMGIATVTNILIVARGYKREEFTRRDVTTVLALTAVLLICAYGGLLPWVLSG